ncbi:MAG TPA: hypothetical protein VG841_15485 [Caulobacterales bacterium]|nr:hypothetical protein [Caulobacterales bacterium]
MSEADIAARLTGALAAAADDAAGGATQLVSIAIELTSREAVARVETRAERKTRTLAFMSADAFDAEGARVASATSVHRIAD